MQKNPEKSMLFCLLQKNILQNSNFGTLLALIQGRMKKIKPPAQSKKGRRQSLEREIPPPFRKKPQKSRKTATFHRPALDENQHFFRKIKRIYPPQQRKRGQNASFYRKRHLFFQAKTLSLFRDYVSKRRNVFPIGESCFQTENTVSKKRIKSLKEESSPQTENFNRTAKKRAKIKRKEERA